MSKLNEHQRSEAWEKVWLSENGYYNPLPDNLKNDLYEFHLDLLELSRQDRFSQLGIELPKGDDSNIEKPIDSSPIIVSTDDPVHDPSHYSFGEKKLWIGFCEDAPSGSRRGTRVKGYPEGGLVHWTGGHRTSLASGMSFMKSSGMNYLMIDELGKSAQSDPLNFWGYHGGASAYAGIGGTVSDELVGIEVMAAGNLTLYGGNYYPWWDKGQHLAKNRIPKSEVVRVESKTGNMASGYYHAYTQAQMIGLRKILCWLYLNNPSVFKIKFIVGHDEVSPGRKTDPGGALVDKSGNPIRMSDFRDWISDDIKAIESNK